MHFKVLCLLLLIKTLKVDARVHIPISTIALKSDETTTESINLPRGFNPQPSPMNPLLYPFVTEEPFRTITGTTSGWRPMITNQTTTKSPALMPLLEDRLDMSSKESEEFKSAEAPVLESIVYGVWKSERPMQPQLSQENAVTEKEINNIGSTTFRNVIRRRLGGFIEENHRGKSTIDASERSASIASYEQKRTSNRQSYKKQGRRKIPNFTEKKNLEPTKSQSQNGSTMKVVKVNASDPELLNIVQQINESAETPASVKSVSKESSSKEGSFAPKLLNSNIKVSKEWPVDFINSNEGSRAQDNSSQDSFYNFVGDSSDPPQAVASLNLDELLDPTATLNITKMGIPYEDQSSSEKPSICVPLAMQERSVSNPNEIVDVERVYCFPLPNSDGNHTNGNDTVIFDKDAHFSVLSYEELTNSGAIYIKGTITLITISFLLI